MTSPFFAAGEEGLKVRGLLLGGHDVDLHFFEPGLFEPAVQVALGKTGPAIAVEFSGFFKRVGQQVQNHDLAAGLENLVGAANGLDRLFGVMEGLTEDHEVHTVGIHRRVLQVALTELEILEAILFGLGRPEGDDKPDVP